MEDCMRGKLKAICDKNVFPHHYQDCQPGGRDGLGSSELFLVWQQRNAPSQSPGLVCQERELQRSSSLSASLPVSGRVWGAFCSNSEGRRGHIVVTIIGLSWTGGEMTVLLNLSCWHSDWPARTERYSTTPAWMVCAVHWVYTGPALHHRQSSGSFLFIVFIQHFISVLMPVRCPSPWLSLVSSQSHNSLHWEDFKLKLFGPTLSTNKEPQPG